MYVIGTAGHVDHGKSRLVLELTGIDPDRLEEEKTRGLTIDLGFAWCTLPSGHEVSIVDVPGHERFIKNMLAGVGGIDLALFVVAADEGVMPQTREHIAILDLLQVSHGVVALTKSDLPDKDWIDLVQADVEELLSTTSLAGAPVVRCSAVRGDGMDDLRAALDRALDALPPVRDIGRARLPVDRVFTISGFGTVVTGTLIDGSLHASDAVVIEPGGHRARVRGLQSHKKTVPTAEPGARTALNLSGIAPEAIERGMVVTTPGWLQPSTAIDVRLRAVADLPRPIRHNASVTLHTGAAEVGARVRLLEGDTLEPGAAAWAQLRLETPIAVARGDFFVLRNTETTIGGGRVVDTRARRHKRNQSETLEALAQLLQGSPDDTLLTVLQQLEPASLAELRRRAELDAAAFRDALARQIDDGAVVALDDASPLTDGTVLVTAAGLEAITAKAAGIVADFVAEHPLRPGIPQEELRSRMGLPSKVMSEFERRLQAEHDVIARSGAYDLAGRAPALSSDQETAMARFLEQLRTAGTKPEGEIQINSELGAYMEARGDVVRVTESIFFDMAIHAQMVDQVVAAIRTSGPITLAQTRDLLDTNRKLAQAFLEDLDQRRITRRVGDARILRGNVD